MAATRNAVLKASAQFATSHKRYPQKIMIAPETWVNIIRTCLAKETVLDSIGTLCSCRIELDLNMPLDKAVLAGTNEQGHDVADIINWQDF